MKHLVVAEYGSFMGIKQGLLVLRDSEKKERHYPLNRLSSVAIVRRGVAFSSDLVYAFSERGIKLFFLNFRGTAEAVLIGNVRHGVVETRKNQFHFCQNNTLPLCKKIIAAKIKNQRAVLNYFAKYHKSDSLMETSAILKNNAVLLDNVKTYQELLGMEGVSSRMYFEALTESCLFSSSFKYREGRGSHEINNSLLNLGYAVLSSYILAAIENAGLEPYMGILHAERPGKLSLVLDVMEEYRAWVVDRVVVKLRTQSEGMQEMDQRIKKILISEIQSTCSKKYLYNKKKVKLEHIMQRQVYRLSGHFSGNKKYRPYLFKW